MANSTDVQAVVIRDFTDEGTGTAYKAKQRPTLPAGVFANYEAAGLVKRIGAETPAVTESATKAN